MCENVCANWFKLGSLIGFLGLGFLVDGVWGLRCGAFWVFWGRGSRYKHRRIILGKNFERILLEFQLYQLSLR